MESFCYVCTLLILARQMLAMRFSTDARLPRTPTRTRRYDAQPRLQDSSGEPLVSWIRVEDAPEAEATDGADVLPIFPINAIEWLIPETEFNLNIIDPGYKRMFKDISDGARRFLVPWTRYVSTFPNGRVSFAEIPEGDRRLHAVGMVMYLEELSEITDETNGVIKFVCRSKAVGRARMTRLLNPSALFCSSEKGCKADYLEAEVEFFNDILDGTDATLMDSPAQKLESLWLDLAKENAKMGFPTPQKMVLQYYALRGMTWELCNFWEDWMLKLRLHQQSAKVNDEITLYLQALKRNGTIQELPPNGADVSRLIPETLLARLVRSQGTEDLQLSDDYWDLLLRLQAAEAPNQRGELLIEAAQAELLHMQTWASKRKRALEE